MFVHILVDCLALTYFVFESAWWGLLRNDIMWTKVDIYVCISTIIIAFTCTLLKYQVRVSEFVLVYIILPLQIQLSKTAG